MVGRQSSGLHDQEARIVEVPEVPEGIAATDKLGRRLHDTGVGLVAFKKNLSRSKPY